MINKIFGPSIHLLVLDMFLENQDGMMNLREIARVVDKNPGSISRVLPILVEKGFLEQIRVGKNMHIYRLNKDNEIVELTLEFCEKLKKIPNEEK